MEVCFFLVVEGFGYLVRDDVYGCFEDVIGFFFNGVYGDFFLCFYIVVDGCV